MTASASIVRRHFAAKTLRVLAAKGIEVVSTTFIPGRDGSFANGETAYNVNDNGCGRILTFTQVLEVAA